VVDLSEEGISEAKLEELAGSQGLFERKFIVFADRLSEKVSDAEIILGEIPLIAESDNVFVFLEGSLKADILKVFKKYSNQVQNFEKVEKKERFNSFSLADALGERNKEKLWILYRKALGSGLSPEELHGTLFWQAKTMRAVSLVQTASEAGLKPFSWTKAKSALKNWKESELRDLTSDLVSIYHNSRRGKHDLETALERLILGI
jgi:DNA polymerase III delta subunit